MTQPKLMQNFVDQVRRVEENCRYYPCDHATQDRLDSIWRVEHPWLALGYRILGLGLLTGCAIGTIAMAYRLVAWVLRWW